MNTHDTLSRIIQDATALREGACRITVSDALDVLANARQIQWDLLALKIQHAGTPFEKASIQCGRDRSWFGQLARGEITRVPFNDGIKALLLLRQVCGEEALDQVVLK